MTQGIVGMDLYEPKVVEIGSSVKLKPSRLLSTNGSHSYWISMIRELSNSRVPMISSVTEIALPVGHLVDGRFRK